MIYADTDFFLALMKREDWLKTSALRLYKKYKGQLWTSSITLIELLLVPEEYGLDPERLVLAKFAAYSTRTSCGHQSALRTDNTAIQ